MTTPGETTKKSVKVGKWNKYNKRRKEAKYVAGKKTKITKEQRREKYTGLARERQLKKNNKDLICYQCREKGHAAQHCPKIQSGASTNSVICFRCGSTEHTLAQCAKGGTSLPFATCFVCMEKGHLASACPQNSNGVFINGGACRHCGSNQHRGKACPKGQSKKARHPDRGIVPDQDISDLWETDVVSTSNVRQKEKTDECNGRPKNRVVTF